MPSVLVWEKLRPQSAGEDVAEALRCEVRDGLWLLARQWQLRELQADDAGTAAAAHLAARAAPVTAIGADGPGAKAFEGAVPLNAAVERVAPAFDLTLRLETGREWRRMLEAAGKRAVWRKFLTTPELRFEPPAPAFEPDDPELPFLSEESYLQLLAAAGEGRAIDGRRLYELLANRRASSFLDDTDDEVDALGRQWRAWVTTLVGPGSVGDTWDPARLRYGFSGAVAGSEGQARCFESSGHDGRTLDWFGFEPSDCPDTLGERAARGTSDLRHTLIPAPVTFPGMPRARWWEMEEEGIDFAGIRAAKTDVGTLLLAQFGLLFSNDWLLVPLPVPYGHLVELDRMELTDVFGVQSSISTIYGREESAQWEIFRGGPGGSAARLFVPPVQARWIQSAPVEQVHFLRDEMANVVWAIELTVPTGTGEGVDGRGAGMRYERWLRDLTGPGAAPPELQANDASQRYVLATDVPPHWIPFIPVRPDPSKPDMVLRRAALPRLLEGQPATRVRPRTRLLRSSATNGTQYDLEEVEVPANGVGVRVVWRRARWLDGATMTWLACERGAGERQRDSGLRFDTLADKAAPASS